MSPSPLVVVDGQSLNNIPDSASSYPSQMMVGRGIPWANVAINGAAFAALTTTATTRRDPVLASSRRSVIVLLGGEGDLVVGISGATLYATMQAYAASARTAGARKVIACTIPPSTAFTGPQEAQRVIANNLILPSSSWDASVDLAANPQLSNAADATYYVDGTHWTAAGATVATGLVGPVLTTVLATL